MIKQETVNIYYCDVCGEKIGIHPPNKLLPITEYKFGEVSFEGKLKCDCCDECREIIVKSYQDLELVWTSNIIGDRFDTVKEEDLKKEIEIFKKTVNVYNEEYGEWRK